MDVEKRKVIKVGESSYAIIVPKNWCRDLGIKAGDYVNVERLNDSLLVYPSGDPPGSGTGKGLRIAIDAKGRKPKQVYEELIAAYTEGVSEVLIKVSGRDLSKVFEDVRRLPGTVVLGRAGSQYVRVAFMSTDLSIDDVVRRLTELITASISECREAARINGLLDEALPLYYLGIRVCSALLSKVRPGHASKVTDYVLVLNYLKEIAERVQELTERCRVTGRGRDGLHKALLYLQELVSLSVKSFLRNDIDLALTVLGKEAEGFDYVGEGLRWSDHALTCVRTVFLRCMDIARVSVSRCIRDKACRCRVFPLIK